MLCDLYFRPGTRRAGIVGTSLWFDGQGLFPVRGRRFVSIPQLLDRLRCLYPIGTVQLFPRGLSDRNVKLTTHLHQEWWSYTSTPPYIFIP
jgi:hypothetical protein